MDEVLVRFPLLGQKVFKQLDEESLSKCKFIDQSWQNLMDNEKGHIENRTVLLKRKIKNFIRKQVVFKNEWTFSLQKVPIELLPLWANCVEQFFTRTKIRIEAQYSPHEIAFTTKDERQRMSLYTFLLQECSPDGTENKWELTKGQAKAWGDKVYK